jgi:hypothetical protein
MFAGKAGDNPSEAPVQVLRSGKLLASPQTLDQAEAVFLVMCDPSMNEL